MSSSPSRYDRSPGARSPAEIKALDLITALEDRMTAFETAHASMVTEIAPAWQRSARNLLHYLALRSTDIRELQEQLAAIGLSSLGRAEAYAQAAVLAVKSVLERLLGAGETKAPAPSGPSLAEGHQDLLAHTEALLGPRRAARRVRIMVTMPSEAADGPQLIDDLVAAGMDVMRINCAHDGEDRWTRMIEHLRAANRRAGQACRVFMDLPGPKLRTGSLELEPGVIHWRPGRDRAGAATGPVRIWLHDEGAEVPSHADAAVPVGRPWRERLRAQSTVTFRDLRGRKRTLRVVTTAPGGTWCESLESCYLGEGTELLAQIPSRAAVTVGHVGKLRAVERSIVLERGDVLRLTRAVVPGRPALRDSGGRILEPARISCTLPEVFDSARAGQSIWFDDGKIGGVIQGVGSDALDVEITQMAKGRAILGADKGINLPQTDLAVRGLTATDLRDLDFVVRHADTVCMSFVQRDEDVRHLEAALRERRARPDFGMVLKIETAHGFENLPAILLAAMGSRPVGVMIARGDLAIECGYERMAELQEEILWVSEAAHVPSIWATQVLESLAKKGVPSRAEITDAAMGERAECVMLNKGPHVVAAVRALDDILRRMEAHQDKKSSRLRVLRLATLLDRPDKTPLGTTT